MPDREQCALGPAGVAEARQDRENVAAPGHKLRRFTGVWSLYA